MENIMYVATINVPGYLPMDDDPPTFDTPAEAWQYLADERREVEDNVWDADNDTPSTPSGYTETVDDLDAKAAGALDVNRMGWDGTGSVSGGTPGYQGDHDLGLAYSVEVAE